MWESIKKFFGFGKSEAVVIAPVVEAKAAAPKKAKAPKAKPEGKEEVKLTAKEIKAKVKKEAPKAEKSEDIDAIKFIYNVSNEKARAYLKVIKQEDREKLREIHQTTLKKSK